VARALYNTYRPKTFAEVIGQEHVTDALQTALRTGRLHHAFLFSGPRGCGKTSSARILAASLNCVDGPTPTPCGICDQCVAIRAGSSMDVIEIDAASHGGVDDARDMRERAAFGPVTARYKIYVVDEAHAVTRDGFNALLKLVEEPPTYLKFVFATTEPDKVIQTIRSRTHHYAFRLVPPAVLQRHLETVCVAEGAEVDPRVLPLVVRAAGGSVRDALSVLDQLLAAGGEEGLTYDKAAGLLGATPAVLLDDTMDAIANSDGATLFRVAAAVTDAGHDPRRFLTDLLTRLRDLIVLDAVPDAGERGLLDDAADDQLVRMRTQASQLGAAGLSRAADIVHAGLLDMRGTASPRLLLELVLARVLLPAAGKDEASLYVRLDRLERRAELVGAPAPVAAAPAPSQAAPAAPAPARPTAPVSPAPDQAAAPTPAAVPAPATPAPPAPAAPAPAAAPVAQRGEIDAAGLRRIWDQVLSAVGTRRRSTLALLSSHAQVADVRGQEVVIGFENPALAKTFKDGYNAEVLTESLGEVLGGHWRVSVNAGSAQQAPAAASRPSSPTPTANSAPVGGPPDFAPGDEAAEESGDDTIDLSGPRSDAAPGGQESALALLRSGLGAQVIEESDST
jgi:DNA polymerase-3 subunit gamma/tau